MTPPVCHHRSVIRRLLALTAALVVLGTPAWAAHPDHTPEGTPCEPGAGTTVVVDLHPAQESIRIACAEGEQVTVSAALTAVGFEPGPTTGLLESLSGVSATTLPDTFWAMYLNTTDGLVGGPVSAAWQFANEGIDAGPVPVDTVLAFHLQDWNENPGREPAVPLSELTAGTITSSSSGSTGASSSAADASADPASDPATDSDGVSGAIWILATVAVLAVVGGATLLILRRRHHH